MTLTPIRCAKCGKTVLMVNYPRLVATIPRCNECISLDGVGKRQRELLRAALSEKGGTAG